MRSTLCPSHYERQLSFLTTSDTKYELLELWVNEVYRAYFEKIPMDERPGMFDKIAEVMLHYFGDEAKELLEESSETMIGDFCDPYNFYTTIGKSKF